MFNVCKNNVIYIKNSSFVKCESLVVKHCNILSVFLSSSHFKSVHCQETNHPNAETKEKCGVECECGENAKIVLNSMRFGIV